MEALKLRLGLLFVDLFFREKLDRSPVYELKISFAILVNDTFRFLKSRTVDNPLVISFILNVICIGSSLLSSLIVIAVLNRIFSNFTCMIFCWCLSSRACSFSGFSRICEILALACNVVLWAFWRLWKTLWDTLCELVADNNLVNPLRSLILQ